MVNEERIPRTFFAFGASAGGIEALIAILDRLPSDLDATVAIVVHRSASHESVLVDIFGRHSNLMIGEPRDGEPVKRGRVYKKRGGLSIAQDPRQALQDSMPNSAIKYDDVDMILPVEEIAAVMLPLAAGEIVGDGDGNGRAAAGGARH